MIKEIKKEELINIKFKDTCSYILASLDLDVEDVILTREELNGIEYLGMYLEHNPLLYKLIKEFTNAYREGGAIKQAELLKEHGLMEKFNSIYKELDSKIKNKYKELGF